MITCKQTYKSPKSTQRGFTIIESLIAILVLAILLAGVAPVIFLSVASRVNARRIERATEAARTYMDGVRVGAIPAPAVEIGDAPDPTTNTGSATFIQDAPAPVAANLPATVDWTVDSGFYCFDLDETAGCNAGSPLDLVIQGFRTATRTTASEGYRLGVRIYRAQAFAGGNLETNVSGGTQSAFTGTLGNIQAPLVEMTTDIAPSGVNAGSLSEWCARLRDTTNTNSTCN
ncbi:MAG: type II secretion system protein [Symploca sp. SIO2C1]|nr:type II secretion system protein [Symploca sp. SIO2C1]